MVEDYQNKTTKTKTEADKRAKEIAVSVHGSAKWNQGGWPTNSGDWVYPSNMGDLYYALQNGPVYGYYAGTESAHLVVITGVNLFLGEVYTNNPWGIAGVQKYEDFLKSYNAINFLNNVLYLIYCPTTIPFVACILVN